MSELFDGVEDATNPPTQAPDSSPDDTSADPDPFAVVAGLALSLLILLAAFVSLEMAGIYCAGLMLGIALATIKL
jgi:hypothetical protein